MLKLSQENICKLYLKYRKDLKFSRKFLIKFIKSNPMSTLIDDIEAEISYLLVRNFRPKTIVEISPCQGWSTLWLLLALKDNNFGKLFSYDFDDNSTQIVPNVLKDNRWKFIQGDVKDKLENIPKKINCLFIDSEHSKSFCIWYIKNLFPRLTKNSLVMVHDVFHYKDEPWQFGESSEILSYLNSHDIQYLTASPATPYGIQLFEEICYLKERLKIKEKITSHKCNPMIFFQSKKEVFQ